MANPSLRLPLRSHRLPRISRTNNLPRRTFATVHSNSPQHVTIVEVGPRDGLQNEKKSIPVATKIELVRRLAQTGLRTIEAGSFVHPKWVPQMANSNTILEHVLATPPPLPHPVTYQWLLPNMRGLDNYFATLDNSAHQQQQHHQQPPQTDAANAYPTPPPSPGPSSSPPNSTIPPPQNEHEISIFLAATESFSQKNTNCSIAESLSRFRPLVSAARTNKTPTRVRGYISVALGCPYEGPDVSPHRVAELATELLEMGCDEVSVADTTGMGTAPRTRELLRTLAAAGIRNEDMALHFHDTYGQALVNTVVGLEHGVRTFDSAVGGLGGCPYSPGATGNVATEDVLHLLHSLGMETGVDMEGVARIGEWITGEIGKGNESRAGKAVLARLRRGE